MSVKVMSWVWDAAMVAGNDLLVLLAIADCASDDGRHAWPSVTTLANKTRLDPRTVQRRIRVLEQIGLLTVDKSAGRGGSNLYAIIMTPRQYATPPGNTPGGTGVTGGVAGRQGGGGTGVTGGVAAGCHPNVLEPSRTVLEPSGGRARATRVPEPFVISGEMASWATGEGYDPIWVDRVTESFVDYWRAKPGKDGTKLDWPATWRRWVRKDGDSLRTLPSLRKPSTTDARVRAGMDLSAMFAERDRKGITA